MKPALCHPSLCLPLPSKHNLGDCSSTFFLLLNVSFMLLLMVNNQKHITNLLPHITLTLFFVSTTYLIYFLSPNSLNIMTLSSHLIKLMLPYKMGYWDKWLTSDVPHKPFFIHVPHVLYPHVITLIRSHHPPLMIRWLTLSFFLFLIHASFLHMFLVPCFVDNLTLGNVPF